ncbi:SDR family oxidoreductase [Parvicella tangerina]|uniref:3-alpha-hydroxycholanate dehydrogenase (NADP(+)) n=1 Tax=Parvicella tangerina TaxID=2829795 RepID=A0A916JMT1_9FLAO|nr:SDR family oxidoreductase [Parvicella tangerina]CAG5081399.1 3-alpha-hydroxycholanate dehydrogenase (NADP(+)) [Parvicella tangerina]
MEIKNVKAIITGGTTGIGYEIASQLLKEGAEVVICGRNEETVGKAYATLGSKGIAADVSNEQDVIRLFDYAVKEMDTVNVLINNAGIGGTFEELANTDVKDFQKVWEINVKGLFLAGKEAAKIFKENDYGNIINIGSTAALKGFAKGSSYVASKFAVSGLTECWRAELRPHNVRVMQVNPSEVITPFYEKMGWTPQNIEKKLKPEQIAHTVVAMLKMNDVGFIPDAAVWATNPW